MKMNTLLILLSFFLVPLITTASDEDKNKNHKEKKKEVHHSEHRFELEVSYSSAMHVEFTGSVYFMPLTKIQATVEDTGHHFAAVLVRELPLGHSKFGTFFGIGSTFGFSKHAVQNGEVHALSPDPGTHMETDWHNSFIIQSGLAYSLSDHWSTGVTLSPGYDFAAHEANFGATIDLVFAF